MQKAQRFTSRQDMEGKQFEVFRYRNQKMTNIGVHQHDFYEIYFFLGGRVNFRIQGQSYQLAPGDILFINPQEPHEAQVDPEAPYERIVLWIDRGCLKELNSETLNLSVCFETGTSPLPRLLHPNQMQRAVLQNILERLTDEYYSSRAGSDLYARSLLVQFLVEVNRIVQNVPHPAARPDAADVISQVLTYIEAHYQQPITLQSLADTFYISQYYLSHEFSRRMGTSVCRYITYKRLAQAKKMMEEGVSPGSVCQSCGFGDYANFYRAFKKECGISPNDYFKSVR